MVGNRMVATRLLFCRGAALGVLLAFFGSVSSGCGGQSVGTVPDDEPTEDCYDLCVKGQKEKCPRADELDCESNCLFEDFMVMQTGCRAEYNDSLECTASLDDICDVVSKCGDEIRAQQDCYRRGCKGSKEEYCEIWQ
jgi:hypothetical protein